MLKCVLSMSSSPVTTHNGEKRENFGFLFIFFLKDNIFTGAFFIFLFWQETIGKDKSASGQPKLWTKKCASCCSYWSRPLVLLTWPPAEVMCNATTATNRVVLHWRIKRHYLFKGLFWSPCCNLSSSLSGRTNHQVWRGFLDRRVAVAAFKRCL